MAIEMDVKNECSQTKNYTRIITEILVAILSSFALVVRCTNNLSQGTLYHYMAKFFYRV